MKSPFGSAQGSRIKKLDKRSLSGAEMTAIIFLVYFKKMSIFN